ncbi:MAG: hypothetical protein WCT52_04355 [Candidatus Micrarchaeia archaeon]
MLKTDNGDKKPAVAAFGAGSVEELGKKSPRFFLRQEGLVENARGIPALHVSKKIAEDADIARLAKSFLTCLYRGKDIIGAGKSARRLIARAKEIGGEYTDEAIDWVDAKMCAFANSPSALKAGMHPKDTIDSIRREVPHLLYSRHHLQLEELQLKKEIALGHGNYDEALRHAQDGAKLALKIGNAWLAYDFELKAIHVRMIGCLAANDMQGAITNAAEAVGFAHSIGRKTPEWVSMDFFIYAYKNAGENGPAKVRSAVLSAIPDFPTNHVKRMEDLKQEIPYMLDYTKGEERCSNPNAAADLARELLEFSFLAPSGTYFANRAWVRETFAKYAGTEIAKYRQYPLEKLEGMLVKRIPDLYAD